MKKFIQYLRYKKLQYGLRKKAYKDFYKLAEQSEATFSRFPMDWNERNIIINDQTSFTPFDPHYIYHPAWAARIIKETSPQFHIDISSILSFGAMLSAFIPVKFYDYRPANLKMDSYETHSADLTQLNFPSNSIESLSCMHTVEHIGLGRYGEPLDYNGDLKAINELKRVLKPEGTLLFVVPVGKPRLIYNAHRIYSYDQVREYFKDLKLIEFSLIPDDVIEKGMIKNASREQSDKQNYGCGCFWFKK
jgi:SAM-dependent methyltransferase